MKKCMSFFLAMLMLASCFTCLSTTVFAAEDKLEKVSYVCTEEKTTGPNGSVESKRTYIYDSKGNLTKVVDDNNGDKHTSSFTYDSKDRVTRKTGKNSEGIPHTTTFTYDSKGNLTKEIEKYSSYYGNYTYTYTYTYDSKGNRTKQTRKTSYGGSETTTYTYNSKGNLIKENWKDTYGNSERTSYTFNSKDKLIKETCTDGFGDSITITYNYNSKEKLTKKTWKNSYGGSDTTTYAYNSKGNLIKETFSSTLVDSSTTTYTYNSKGNLIKEIYKRSGESSCTTTYKYDSKGNLIAKYYKDGSGSSKTYTYKYKKAEKTVYRFGIYKFLYDGVVSYTGNPVRPAVSCLVVDEIDAWVITPVIRYKDNTKKGTARIVVTLDDGQTVELPFTIRDKEPEENSTLDTYVSEKQEYIDEHVAFLSDPMYKAKFVGFNYAAEMFEIKECDSSKYKWDKIISFDFNNYYDVVISDLILKKNTEPEIKNIALKYVTSEGHTIANTLADTVISIVNGLDAKNITEFNFTKNDLFDFFLDWDGVTETNTFKQLSKLFRLSEEGQKTFNKVCIGLDKTNTFLGYVGTGVDVWKIYSRFRNYVTAMNAYQTYSEDFKDMLKYTRNQAKSAGASQKLISSLNGFVNSTNSFLSYGGEVIKADLRGGISAVLTIFEGLFLKSTLKMVANIIPDAIVATEIGSITIGTAISSVISGVGLGFAWSNIITNASDLSQSMGTVIAVGELSTYVQKAVTHYGQSLKSSHTYDNASHFDAACSFYKQCEQYSREYTNNALKAEKDSVVTKLFKAKYRKDYQELIDDNAEEIAKLNVINCHKQTVEEMYNKGFLSFDKNVCYNGEKTQTIVKFPGAVKGTDYKLTFSNCSKPGQAKVKITGMGKYLKGSKTFTYRIFDIKLSAETLTYTGEERKPTVTVTYSDGKVLEKGKDYTLTYSNCKGPTTTARVTVKFKGSYSGELRKVYSIIPGQVQNLKASSVKCHSVKLTWDKVKGADAYNIYRYSSGTYKYITSVSGTSVTLTDLTSGAKYTYAVKAYKKVNGNKVLSAKYSTKLTVCTKLLTPKIASVTPGSKKATVKWNAIARAAGYQLAYATSKSGTYKTVLITKTSCTKTSLTKGKTYYFKVRAYRTVDGKKVYSDYSDIKSAKIK